MDDLPHTDFREMRLQLKGDYTYYLKGGKVVN